MLDSEVNPDWIHYKKYAYSKHTAEEMYRIGLAVLQPSGQRAWIEAEWGGFICFNEMS